MPHLRKSPFFLSGLAALSLLVSCSGGGGGDDINGSDGSGSSTLFIADTSLQAVGGYGSLNPSAGSTVTGKTFTVSGLGSSIAYDSGSKELYTFSGTQVRVVSGANTASGTPTFSRTITIDASVGLTAIKGIVLDKTNNRLYVGGSTGSGGVVGVINNASTATGTVTPSRTLGISDGVKAMAIDVANNRMYVLSPTQPGVEVFNISGTGSGNLTPAGTLLGTITGLSLAVDSGRSRLYVADATTSPGGIRIVSGLNTTPVDQGMTVLFGTQYLTLDAANDRLYVGSNAKAYIFNSASALGPSATAPSAITFSGLGSSLAGFAF